MLDKTDLLACFADVGVRSGGTLFVHSSLSSFGTVRGGEHTVIDALLETVGPDGLLAMPTHTWSTVSAEQPVFHQHLSPSITGRITESFRRRPSAAYEKDLVPTATTGNAGLNSASLIRPLIPPSLPLL